MSKKRGLITPEEIPHLGGFSMLPTPPGTCPECAVEHGEDEPHNRDSLAYQYKFYGERGRWPVWKDACAHCPADVQAYWKEELAAKGASWE